MKITRKSIKSRVVPTWCAGCGNLGILRALHSALEELELHHEEVLIVYGIGCAGNEADFNHVYGLHALHGREIPNAVGAKLANHDLKVIVVGGDGDLYGEGISHLLSGARGNHDITVLVHNNWRYSLTTGQASPTTPRNTITKTSPEGLIEVPLNPLKVALSVNASFVAQGASSNFKQLTEIIKAGINHPGFALIDVAQLCVTFNKENNIDWFRNNIAELENHDATDWQAAFNLTSSDREKILTGIYYQNTETPAYHKQVEQLQAGTLLSQWQNEVELGDVMKNYL